MARRMSYRSRDGTLKPRKQNARDPSIANKSQAGEFSNPPYDSEDEDDYKVFYDMPVLSEEKMCNMQKMIKNPKHK